MVQRRSLSIIQTQPAQSHKNPPEAAQPERRGGRPLAQATRDAGLEWLTAALRIGVHT